MKFLLLVVFLNKNKYCSEDVTKKFIKECYYNNFVSNIADVNVNKYYSKNNLSLKPITPLFCDSLILNFHMITNTNLI